MFFFSEVDQVDHNSATISWRLSERVMSQIRRASLQDMVEKKRRPKSWVVLLMAEILHQLRLVVYPIITRFCTSQLVQDFFHQHYVGSTPEPVTVTTRVITFLVRNTRLGFRDCLGYHGIPIEIEDSPFFM